MRFFFSDMDEAFASDQKLKKDWRNIMDEITNVLEKYGVTPPGMVKIASRLASVAISTLDPDRRHVVKDELDIMVRQQIEELDRKYEE